MKASALPFLFLLVPLPGCFPELDLRTCTDLPLGSVDACNPCTTYCEFVTGQCSELFPGTDPEARLATCQNSCDFDFRGQREGRLGDEGTDTLGCRMTQAGAQRCGSAGLEPSIECPSNDCIQYCRLMEERCPEQYPSRGSCITSCVAFPEVDDGVDRNSLDCRLTEVQGAADLAGRLRREACAAAGPTGGGTCGLPCSNYCNAVETNCTGDLQLYASREQCQATCELFPAGSQDDFNVDGPAGDTSGCRLWHALAAGENANAATLHCPHARAYNPMFCGTRFETNPPPEWPCQTFCNLMERTCSDVYPDRVACLADCGTFPALDGLSPMDQPQIYPVTSTVCPTGPGQ